MTGISVMTESRVTGFEIRGGGDSISVWAQVNASGEVTVLDMAVAEHVAKSSTTLDTSVVMAKLVIEAFERGKRLGASQVGE